MVDSVESRPERGKGSVGKADPVGRHLRRLYDDVVAQPVPDRFLELLKALDGPEVASPEKVA